MLFLTTDGDKKVALEGDYAGTGMGKEFTLTMNCSLTGVGGNDTSDTKYWLLAAHQNQTSWFIGAQYDTSTNQITIGNADHTLTNAQSFGVYDITDIKTVSLVMFGALNEEGTIAVYVNGQKAAQANVADYNRHANAGFNNGVVFMNKMGEHDGVVGTITSASLYNIAIPEPGTATLSLLALAGLAARRRRK